MVNQITFEVEQKELAILAAPTRLEDKRQALEMIFSKYKKELEYVDQAFADPQLDRGLDKPSVMDTFTEGYTRLINHNQYELDRIDDVKIAFKNGKAELITRMGDVINDFRDAIMAMSFSFKDLKEKFYFKSRTWGLEDRKLVHGSSTWPTEDDLLKYIGTRHFMNIRVKEIRYYKVGSILSLQFVWTNGVVSPFAGSSGVDRCS